MEIFSGLYFENPAAEEVEDLEKAVAFYWKDGEGPETFAEQSRLGTGLDRYDRRIQTVNLMTIHAAKGLEFDLIYIPGCEDSLIPCTLAGENSGVDAEEEKRLLYVAMTRARKDLVLSWAETRIIFGKTMNQKESPFLAAIEQELLNRQRAVYEKKQKPGDDQLLLFN